MTGLRSLSEACGAKLASVREPEDGTMLAQPESVIAKIRNDRETKLRNTNLQEQFIKLDTSVTNDAIGKDYLSARK